MSSSSPNSQVPEFKIRAARQEDALAISELIQPVIRSFVSHEYSPQGQQTMLNATSESSISEYLKNGLDYLLAEQNGQLIGVLAMKEQNHIFHCFVDENHHRKGIAKQLWQHYLATQEKSLSKDSEQVEFTVNSSRFAIKFYQSLGFESSKTLFEKGGITCYPMIYQFKTK